MIPPGPVPPFSPPRSSGRESAAPRARPAGAGGILILGRPRARPAARRRAYLYLLGCAAFLVSACASTPQVTPVADPQRVWAERQAELARITGWTAIGHMAVQAPDEGLSVSLSWTQQGDSYRVRVHGPLGSGAAELSGGPDGVVLRESGDRTWHAADPEQLMRERLGWSLPVTGLRYWILGRVEPGAALDGFKLDAAGRPEELRQSGWYVHFLDFGRFDGVLLPTRIYLHNPPLTARILVNRWELRRPGTVSRRGSAPGRGARARRPS